MHEHSFSKLSSSVWRKYLVSLNAFIELLAICIVRNCIPLLFLFALELPCWQRWWKHMPTVQETQVWSLGWEDPLEKEMATHSSILAWKIPWTEEPGRLQSMGLQRVGHDWATLLLRSPIRLKISSGFLVIFLIFLLSNLYFFVYFMFVFYWVFHHLFLF